VSNGGWDAFLTKFDSSGNFVWARTWGASYHDTGYGAAVDGLGNVVVAGYFSETVDFDPGLDLNNHASNGGYDTFLTKFDSSGNFVGARTWGGTEEDCGYGAAVDGSGNVYVTGSFGGTVDFDPGTDVDNHVSNGDYGTFLTKLDSTGNFIWARTWGGAVHYDFGHGAAVDGSGNVYVIGNFELMVDFDPGPDLDNHMSNGSADTFLTKFDSTGDFIWAKTWGGAADDWGRQVAVDASGNAYVTGVLKDEVDFDPGPGVDSRVSNGYEDAFLSKFPPDGNW
jgi:hypothetical protein